MKRHVVTVTLNPAIDKTVTVNNLKIGALNRVSSVRTDPGGKGINVAKVLNAFNVDVVATGLTAGYQGRQLIRYLNEEGIAASFHTVQGEIRTNLKIVDEETKVTTEINETGFSVNEADLSAMNRLLEQLLDNASFLVLSGSLPSGIPEDIYKQYIERAKEKGVKAILDADGNALAEGIKAIPYAIKPNIHELERLFNRSLKDEEEIICLCRELISSGIKLAAVSMGAEGAIFMNEKEAFRIKPCAIAAGSTVGAGDSMVAAIVYSLLESKAMIETASMAAAAGTVTASKSGTQVCTLEEVLALYKQIQISRL